MSIRETVIQYFRVGEETFILWLNIDDDSTKVTTRFGEVRFRVTNHAEVMKEGTPHFIGHLRLDSVGYWYFKPVVGDDLITTGTNDIMKAEVRVFKKLLEMNA